MKEAQEALQAAVKEALQAAAKARKEALELDDDDSAMSDESDDSDDETALADVLKDNSTVQSLKRAMNSALAEKEELAEKKQKATVRRKEF